MFDILYCQPLIILTSGQNNVGQECCVGGGIKFLSYPVSCPGQQKNEENRPTSKNWFAKIIFIFLFFLQPGVIFCGAY